MSTTNDYTTALLIFATAVLGGVAMVLTPALFEEFHTGRLIAVITLLGTAIATGFIAKRNRKKIIE